MVKFEFVANDIMYNVGFSNDTNYFVKTVVRLKDSFDIQMKNIVEADFVNIAKESNFKFESFKNGDIFMIFEHESGIYLVDVRNCFEKILKN